MSYQIDKPPRCGMTDNTSHNDFVSDPATGSSGSMAVSLQNHGTTTDDPGTIGQVSGNARCPIRTGEIVVLYGEEFPGNATRTPRVRRDASGEHICRKTGCENPPAKIRWLNTTVRKDSGGTTQ